MEPVKLKSQESVRKNIALRVGYIKKIEEKRIWLDNFSEVYFTTVRLRIVIKQELEFNHEIAIKGDNK